MAFASFLALIDDIATATKVAAVKTVSIVSDDISMNAVGLIGLQSERELKVIKKVAKGSLINKLIILPFAIFASYFMPWVINPIMIMAGLYLLIESAESIIEAFSHDENEDQEEELSEGDKVTSAIKTDFALSLEIIVLSLGVIADKSILTQAISLIIISLFATVFVYGLVALIIRLDDIGLAIIKRSHGHTVPKHVGGIMVKSTPIIMKALTVIGTGAMVVVGGEILVERTPLKEMLDTTVAPYITLNAVTSTLLESLIGLCCGLLLVGCYTVFKKVFSKN